MLIRFTKDSKNVAFAGQIKKNNSNFQVVLSFELKSWQVNDEVESRFI